MTSSLTHWRGKAIVVDQTWEAREKAILRAIVEAEEDGADLNRLPGQQQSTSLPDNSCSASIACRGRGTSTPQLSATAPGRYS